ncbi:MAG: phosphatase [Bacteroidetes bacterium]|nr:phosphatase [Bacteroidota bacterium]
MKKIAVIDLGTNTFNLLIAEVPESGKHHIIYSTQVPAKIGEKAINENKIIPAAFDRGVQCLKDMKGIIGEYDVDDIFAFGTSALRGASNGKEFAETVKKETGINIHIIDGHREAELIYNGVQLAFPCDEKLRLVLDVGGGSNEFIIANKNKVFWSHSFNLGVARLLYKFQPSNPMKAEEIQTLENYLEQELAPLWEALKKFPATDLIGCAGCFSSFHEMICAQNNIELNDKSTWETIPLDGFQKIHNLLLPSSYEERMEMEGLVFMRADMIVIGTILVNLVIKKAHVQNLYLSKYALKEGVLNEIANNKL